DISEWGVALDEIRAAALRHIEGVRQSAGDWRPAVDGLRFQLSALWERLEEEDRLAFLRSDAGAWGMVRHRMAPSSRQRLDDLRRDDRLVTTAAEVLAVAPLTGGGLRVTLSDGTT